MTLPRRQPDHAAEPSAGAHIDEIIERNLQEYHTIASEIVERLQKDMPASHLDDVVETILYRFGRLVSDRNRAINEAALLQQQQQQQQQEQQQQQPQPEQPVVIEQQQQQPQQQVEPDRRSLKKWFCGHLSYPYPTNEEKEALALECHMTVRQVSNWFINVRMRIWTPLVRRYGLVIPERALFERSHVVLPDEAVHQIRRALT